MGVKRYLFILGPIVALALIGAVVFRREGGAKPPVVNAQAPSVEPKADVIEATAEQMKQIKVETVHEQAIDLDLETTGKVGFNEDRLTPVLAPYNGSVLEV